ncbi:MULTISPECIES: hypothetical protein [Olivibacter]|uniref:Uncharacterized protein n=1 Tax=Olivibacter jilunii TaxID=985016 RepID=A0ABW6B2K3_9SPHI
MENNTELFKGELMEEKLRMYFLQNGYYVARGVKYTYENNEITDLDLFLYGRVSIMTRERTNVDLKNKKNPKAFERILWAKGLQNVLDFDNCVVGTMDRKESVKNFARLNAVTLLDGSFLQKLNYKLDDRLSEEEFMNIAGQFSSLKEFSNANWKNLYERSKSKLLNELDYSGFNSTLLLIKYFINNFFNIQKKETSIRLIYVIISHSLVILDYILKDIAFLEIETRREHLSNGFKYGNLGEAGITNTVEMAVKISGSKMTSEQIKNSLDKSNFNILSEYFAKAENIKNIFKFAILFEEIAFNRSVVAPDFLPLELKSIVAVFLDYFEINRKKFFS